MNLRINAVHSATNEAWDFIWNKCPYATYFHSREWAEIWHSYSKATMRPCPILIGFSDGKKALLPLSFTSSAKGLVRDYVSSPAGTFGGWISADLLDSTHAELLVTYLMNKCGNITWRINPYDELISKTVFTMAVQDETHAIKLQDCFETICKQYSRGQKSAMHKAERLGVSVKLGSTMEDWQAYYDTYEDSLRRWGEKASSSYTFDLFREMFRRDSDCVKLFLATYDEKIIAGALCFYSKWHAVYWHGAALEYYFKLRPVNMLMSEAIKTACEEGYTWFDFNPSGGHQGVKAFKESFGAQALPCPVVRTESVRSRVIGKSSRIIEKIREIASLLLNR